MNRLNRVAIVGLGGIGAVHTSNLQKLGLQPVGGVDPSPESRERFKEVYPNVPLYESLPQLLEEVPADGVILATPPSVRIEPIEVALEHGLKILCEKPLARTLEECNAIMQLPNVAENLHIGFCHRHVEAVQAARKILKEGTLGELVWINVNFSAHAPFMRERWFTDPSISGGGAAMDNACHALDLCQFISGTPVDSRGSYRKTWAGRGEDSFSFSGNIGTALCTVTGSYVTAISQACWEVMGTKAALRYDYAKGDTLTLIEADQGEKKIPTEDPSARFLNQLKAWLNQETSDLATLSQGYRIAEIIDRATTDNS